MKHCPTCDKDLPRSKFGKNRSKKDGLTHDCLECRHIYQATWRNANRDKVREVGQRYARANLTKIMEKNRHYRKRRPDLVRKWWLKAKWGLTPEQYESILAIQGGGCGICKATPNGNGRAKWLYIDHDHESGFIRGLLCARCNIALNRMVLNTQWIKAAKEYCEMAERRIAKVI